MTTRCISCNSYHDFKATRGSKLKDQRCSCGGAYELLAYWGDGIYQNRKDQQFKIDFLNKKVTQL